MTWIDTLTYNEAKYILWLTEASPNVTWGIILNDVLDSDIDSDMLNETVHYLEMGAGMDEWRNIHGT